MSYRLLLASLLPVALLASASPQQEGFDFTASGNDFLRVCKINEGNATVTNGACLGYVNGVLDGVDLAAGLGAVARKETPKKALCLPSESTMGQKYRVVLKFINDHPEKAHLPTNLLILEATAEAFPCPQVKAPDTAPAK
jgi:hypothetical protein